MKKACEMTADQIRACSLKCPIKLAGQAKGKIVTVAPQSGDWLAYPAKTEQMKKYWREAKKDLNQRQIGLKTATNDFHGDFGRVRIGGKMFSFFPKSGMLVRDDFADWCERHFDECWDSHFHRQRLPKKDDSGKEVEEEEIKVIFADARKRAINMRDVTELVEPGHWSTQYDMKKELAYIATDIRRHESNDKFFVGTKILADQLAAQIAYREKHFSDAANYYIECAAAALRAAQFVQKMAGQYK